MATVDTLMDAFRKEHGERVITTGNTVVEIDRIPTGVFALDLILGGGIPKSRVTEIFGPPSACKSNLANLIVASQQKLRPDLKCIWIAVEPFDPTWAKKFGVDTEKLLVVNPSHSEQIVDISEGLVQADDCGLVVLDSYAAMVTQREMENSAEKQDPGGSGMIGKKLCNKILKAQRDAELNLSDRLPTFIVLNQIRHKIGVFFGSPETTPGGFSLEHAAALRLRLYAKNITDKKVNPTLPCRKEIRAEVKKNKVPIVASECIFEMAMIPQPGLATGKVDNWSTLVAYLKKHAILLPLEKGHGYKMGPEHFQTLIAVRDKIIGDPDLYAMLTKDIITAEVSAIQDELNVIHG